MFPHALEDRSYNTAEQSKWPQPANTSVFFIFYWQLQEHDTVLEFKEEEKKNYLTVADFPLLNKLHWN